MAAPEIAAAASDEELVGRVRRGDETAFQILYERYFRRVYHFLDKRLRNRADTEDVTQEVFLNLFHSVHSFRGSAPFTAWVFGVTRRTLANRFKKRRHATVPLADGSGEDAELATTGGPTDPLAIYECREWIGRLEETLDRDLTAEQRQLFDLHHLQRRSIQDIAQALRKSEDSVKSNLYRARKLLLAG